MPPLHLRSSVSICGSDLFRPAGFGWAAGPRPDLRIPIRAVIDRDEGSLVAHCLEFDLMGDGPTHAAALSSLGDAISLQVAAAVEHDNPDNLFRPADGKLFAMFAAGDDVAAGELHLRMGAVTVDGAETREFDAALVAG